MAFVSYGWYFTFVQGFVYLFLIYLQGFSPKKMVNPWKTYVKLSAVLMGSHGLTKGSLAFLNYPAQLMFKSTKVLPVMVMGAFIPGLRRKYPAHKYVSAILLVLGLILFTLADAQISPSFSVIGVIMVIGALVMDSFLGNLQEVIFNMNPETTQMEMLFCSTVVGLPLLIPPMVLTGEVFEAWNSCSEARLRKAASLEKHVLLKKLRDALESLKGRVAGRNKDDILLVSYRIRDHRSRSHPHYQSPLVLF